MTGPRDLWNRRDFVRIGSLGVFGLSLADYFRLGAAGPGKDRSCILIWLKPADRRIRIFGT